MSIVNLNQQLKRVEISDFELENEIVFNFFNSLSVKERDEKLFRLIYIGVLAMMEDRIAAFLSKTHNELGTELESLKMIFEMKKELFFRSSVKGLVAEEEIAEYLNNLFRDKKINDEAILTGNIVGSISKNKTGDIVCEVNGDPELKIVIESKFDKNVKLGDIDSKDIFTKKTDTAWSQLLEAQVNREAKISIIVFDISLVDNSILKVFENVGYIPSIGFISIVDSQKGNYSNLAIAYMLARDILLNSKELEFDKELLSLLINRTIKDINEVLSIKSLVHLNIENNKQILKQLEKGLLLMEFNQKYLSKFLKDGKLTKKDLLSFYQGEDVKGHYRSIEKQIEELGNNG